MISAGKSGCRKAGQAPYFQLFQSDPTVSMTLPPRRRADTFPLHGICSPLEGKSGRFVAVRDFFGLAA